MPTSLHIPGIVDILRVSDPSHIRALVRDERLDRRFQPIGPLLNRLIVGRIRRMLQLDGTALPSVAPRHDTSRIERQAMLDRALDPVAAAAWTDSDLDAPAAWVLGHGDLATLGPEVLRIVGRLFVPGYKASELSWRAAQVLDAAPRSFNPLRRLYWLVTGSVARARWRLASEMNGDGAAVHALGIASHNLVRSLQNMRMLAREPGATRRVTAETAVALCLAAPPGVLRQSAERGTTIAGELRKGTLVFFQLDAARARTLQADITFMTGTWSHCPAHAWVPALLAAVWQRVVALGGQGGRP